MHQKGCHPCYRNPMVRENKTLKQITLAASGAVVLIGSLAATAASHPKKRLPDRFVESVAVSRPKNPKIGKTAGPNQKSYKRDSAQVTTNLGEKHKLPLSVVLDRMQQVIDRTKSFTADFEQVYQSAILGFGQEHPQRGRVKFRKPAAMRWDYVNSKGTPTKAFIVHGNMLWIVDHQKKQTHVNRCFQQDSLSAPLTFLWGQGKLKKTFDARWLELAPGSAPKNRGELVIVLTPKKPCSLLRKLIVTVNTTSFEILQTELVDPSGNRNRFTYGNVKHNVALNHAVFAPPSKGMRVYPIPGSCSPKTPSPQQSKAKQSKAKQSKAKPPH